MNGVEILKETAIYENLFPQWFCKYLLVACVMCVIISLAAFAFYLKEKDSVDKYISIIMLVLTAVGSSLFIYGVFPSQKVAYTEYQVTIDDSVSFNEFTEKYEIIVQEGKIYTVKEKWLWMKNI